MIVENKQNLFSLIGETSPYLNIELENINFENITTFCFNQTFGAFENEHFSDFIKILSTIGSIDLANKINLQDKNYFLAEKLRVRKTSFGISNGLLTAKIYSQIENERKGKSMIEVKDQNSIIFKFEIDYYIINKLSFQKLFIEHYNEIKTDQSFNPKMPLSAIEYISPQEFILTIDKFKQNHCLGHFDNFPIVPAVFMTKCILEKILKTINESNFKDIEVDCVEMFLNKAMPIETVFKVNVQVTNLLKNLKKYKCVVYNDKIEYGYYLITLKF